MSNVEKAVEVYNEMISEKMKPSLITYTSILQILIKSKRIQNAIEIFEEILQNKMNPDQVLFNVIINGCVFNGKLEEACKFLFESFNANIRLCDDVYRNILNNLLTNRTMEVNHKNEITLKVCKEIKSRGLQIDYEIYHKIMKMIYKNQGKNADYTARREENYGEERSCYSENYTPKKNYNNNYYGNDYNNGYNGNAGYNKYNSYYNNNNGGYKGKWKN